MLKLRQFITILLFSLSISISYPQYCAYKGGYFTKMGDQWHEYGYNNNVYEHYISRERSQDNNYYYLDHTYVTGLIIAIPKSKSVNNSIMVIKGQDRKKAADIITIGDDNPGHSPRAFVYDNGIFMLIKGKMLRYDKNSKLGKYDEYEIYKTTDAFYLIKNGKEYIGVPRNWYDSFQKYDSKQDKWVTFSKALALYDDESPNAGAGMHYDDNKPLMASNNSQSTGNKKTASTTNKTSTGLGSASRNSSQSSQKSQSSYTGANYTTTREETGNGNFNIIKHYSDGSRDKIIYSRCGVCFGDTRCSNCKGRRICDYCHGSGRGSGIVTSRCIVCNGTGKCKNCNGDGKCHYCLNQSEYPGYSKVMTLQYDKNGKTISNGQQVNNYNSSTSRSYPSNTQKSRVCPTCHGKGVVYHFSYNCNRGNNDCYTEFCSTCGDNHCKEHGWHEQCYECNGRREVDY